MQVFQLGHYEDDIAMNSGWGDRDWNGEGEFDTSDLVFAFQDGGYELGILAEVSTVPEPTGQVFVVACGIVMHCLMRRRFRFISACACLTSTNGGNEQRYVNRPRSQISQPR